MSRKLILTIGAPAVGKSTWLKENGLSPYVLEVDHLRTLVSEPIIHINKEGTIQKDDINYGKEHATWDLLDSLIEQRMNQGQAIIVDATHLFRDSFGRYHELAKKYNYKMIGIDFMKDFIAKYEDNAKEELMKRDSGRDDKIGKEDVFDKYLDRYTKLKESLETGSIIKVYTPQEFLDYIHDDTPINLDEYDNIKIIGDIHGDYSNLDKVFEQHKEGTFYIFVGDYLDRGSKNVETFKMLQTLKGKNLVFLRGNHEQAIQNWVYNHHKSGQFGLYTLEILLKAGITDDDLNEFISRLQDYFLFSYKGMTYLVTHAGIINWPNRPLKLLYEDFFTLGIAEDRKTPYESDVDREYNRHVHSENLSVVRNVHGHRNEFEYNKEDWEFNYSSCNLTHEGEFRYLEIKDFINYISDTNPDMELHIEKRIDVPGIVSQMYADKDIKEVYLDDDIVSHNFTREVFNKGRWTPRTLNARGLFTRGDDIIGRGFKKFFNVGENPEATLESLVFPVNVYNKWNGFLAIAFWDTQAGTIKIETKSGKGYKQKNQDIDTLYMANLLVNKYDQDNETKLTRYLQSNPQESVLFEVMAPTMGDTHIIKYDKDEAHPIAIINNNTGKRNRNNEFLSFGIYPEYTAQNLDDLKAYLESCKSQDREGVVLLGQNKMLKQKTDFYLKAKELRSALSLEHKKKNWYYDAEDWYTYCAKHHINRFSPELALSLHQKENN